MRKTKKKAWAWFSKYFRLKNSDSEGNVVCYTCDKKMFWKESQSGHLLDGRCNAILFLEEAIKIQCSGCNVFKSGNKELYIPKFIDEVGREKYDEICRIKNTTVKYSKRDLEEMRDNWKMEAKRLAKEKGLTI